MPPIARIEVAPTGIWNLGGINRGTPDVLVPYVPEGEGPKVWHDFCDKIDSAVRPVARLLALNVVLFCLSFILFAIVTLLAFVFVHEQDPDEEESSGSDVGFSVYFLFIVPFATMACAICIMCYVGQRGANLISELQQICRETSALHTHLKFSLRHQPRNSSTGISRRKMKSYIEIFALLDDDSTCQPLEQFVATSGPEVILEEDLNF